MSLWNYITQLTPAETLEEALYQGCTSVADCNRYIYETVTGSEFATVPLRAEELFDYYRGTEDASELLELGRGARAARLLVIALRHGHQSLAKGAKQACDMFVRESEDCFDAARDEIEPDRQQIADWIQTQDEERIRLIADLTDKSTRERTLNEFEIMNAYAKEAVT